MLAYLSLTPGSASTAATSLRIFSTTACAVPLGASSAVQALSSKPAGPPDSATVGTSGKPATRCGAATPTQPLFPPPPTPSAPRRHIGKARPPLRRRDRQIARLARALHAAGTGGAAESPVEFPVAHGHVELRHILVRH